MSKAHRVLWGEGMFLRPQHFQQHDHYLQALFTHCRSTVHAHPWGLARLEVDEEALGNGLLRLDRLEVVFQDGAMVRAPQEDPLPTARNLDDIPNLGVASVIYACLPGLNAYGGNCPRADTPQTTPSRFSLGHAQVSDLFTQALDADLTVLHANVRLMAECENRDALFCIPILRIARDPSGRWHRDDSYIPPILELSASPYLIQFLRRILDICQVKSLALAAGHREQAKHIAGFGTQDVVSYWLLHTVHRTYPILAHALRFPSVHPEHLYLALAQMAAELLTFSSNLTLACIPPYDHGHLTQTFEQLDDVLRSMLDTVISNRSALVPLSSPKPGFLAGRLEENMLDNADFYLSVSSEAPAAQVIETIPFKLKIGGPDDVEKILNSALPGIRLTHATQTPSAIPVRIGNHYFALEKNSILYSNMLKSRSICIYKPQSLPEMKLEIYAIFR